MSILRWKAFDEMLSIRDEVDRLFDKMFERNSFQSLEERYALMSSGATSFPEFNVYQRGDDTVIQVNLPEFEKGDIKVSVSGNLLAIGSEVSREREFRGNDAYRYHRSRGSFCRIMELPPGANANNIRSSFNNGILEVVIPKAGRATSNQKTTTIEVKPALPGNRLVDTLPSNALPDHYGDDE